MHSPAADDAAAGHARLLRDIAQLANPEPTCTAFATVGSGRDGHVRCNRRQHVDPWHAGSVRVLPGAVADASVTGVVCWEDTR